MKEINILEYLESSLIGKKIQNIGSRFGEGGTVIEIGFHPEDMLICLLVEKNGKRGFAYFDLCEKIHFID